MEKRNKKLRLRLTIGNKILSGFSALMLLYIVNVAIIFFTRNTINQVLDNSKDIIRPSQDAINDFILLVTKSKMFATNWVYLQTYEEDKQALRTLKSYDYPELKERILSLTPQWENDSQKVLMDSALHLFEAMLKTQEEGVMSQLVTFDNYEDPVTKLLAEDVVVNQIIPQSVQVIKLLETIRAKQEEITQDSDNEITSSVRKLGNVTLILGGIFLTLGMLSAFLIMRSITGPVNFLKNVVVRLGRGELNIEDRKKRFSNDEIGEMAVAMDNLVSGLKATTLFAENIGNGNYNSEFKPLSDHDVLGNALLEMRTNLSKVSEDDKKRNWANEGTAKFGEILRTNTNDLDKLTEEIVGNLVKYLDANQGAIYIMDEVDAESEPTMSMKACYAWDRKKYMNQKIYRGEGLAGQAWQEGDTIYLTEVPQDYIRIASGLGDSNPTSVLIVPLKFNEQIFGVVEIASFNEFRDFEIEFVQKIAESIASTISSAKINARTQKLLIESQEMTEQMRAQEEEMRQNMEELQATQEEMQRSQAEAESTMQAINDSMAVAEYDDEGRISKINQNYLEILGYKKDEVLGEYQRIFVPKEEKTSEEFKQLWKDLAIGVPRRGVFNRVNRRGEVVRVYAAYSPIKNRSGSVVKIMEVTYEMK